MKKVLTAFIALLIVFTAAGCSKTEPVVENKDALTRIKEQGFITIATEGNWAPWTFHDDSGELVGLDVEIGKAIAEQLGVEARFEETNWDSILAGVDAGRFDLACNGVGYTEERAKKYAFSEPYVYTKKVLIVRGDDTSINSFEDIKGKKNANTASSTYAALAESYGAENTPVDSLTETITLLLQERVDCTINSQVSYNDYLAAHPDANIRIADVASGDKVVIPMKMGDDTATLVEAVNNALNQLRDSGKLSEISIKYFGTDNTKED